MLGRKIYGIGITFTLFVYSLTVYWSHKVGWGFLDTFVLFSCINMVILAAMMALVAYVVFRPSKLEKGIKVWASLSAAFFAIGFYTIYGLLRTQYLYFPSFGILYELYLVPGLTGSVLLLLDRRTVGLVLIAVSAVLLMPALKALGFFWESLGYVWVPIPHMFCAISGQGLLGGLFGIASGLSFFTLLAALLYPGLGPIRDRPDWRLHLISPGIVALYSLFYGGSFSGHLHIVVNYIFGPPLEGEAEIMVTMSSIIMMLAWVAIMLLFTGALAHILETIKRGGKY